MPGTISYMPAEPRPRWRIKRLYLVIGLIAFLLLISGLLPISVRGDQYAMCSICGSSQQQTDWEFGVTSGRLTRLSSLDAWITKNLGGHTHTWKHMSTVGCNLLGARVYNACSSAPPIYGMSSFLDDYIKNGSTQEITAFIKVMQTGTEPQQELAVRQAADIVFAPPTAPSMRPR